MWVQFTYWLLLKSLLVLLVYIRKLFSFTLTNSFSVFISWVRSVVATDILGVLQIVFAFQRVKFIEVLLSWVLALSCLWCRCSCFWCCSSGLWCWCSGLWCWCSLSWLSWSVLWSRETRCCCRNLFGDSCFWSGSSCSWGRCCCTIWDEDCGRVSGEVREITVAVELDFVAGAPIFSCPLVVVLQTLCPLLKFLICTRITGKGIQSTCGLLLEVATLVRVFNLDGTHRNSK